MKQLVALVLMLVLLGAVAGVAQPPASQTSPHAPAEQKPPPKAAPADVESIDAIINTMYQTLSGPKGEERDWDRLRSLFLQDARYIAARPGNEQAGASVWFMSVADFVALTKRTFERGGYYETEIARQTEQFGEIAHVWSTYEARYTPEAEPHSRGIYSLQLFNDGTRWFIVNAYWAFEREDAPIPERYLGEPEE